MIYSFNMDKLPVVHSLYAVERRTVWKVADPYNILIIILWGRCYIEAEGKEYLLEKGDVFFIPANCVYTRKPYNDEMCTIFYTHFLVDEIKIWEDASALRDEIIKLRNEIDKEILGDNHKSHSTENTVYIAEQTRSAEKLEELMHYVSNALKYIVKNSIESRMIAALNICNIFGLLTEITLKSIMAEGQTSLSPATPHKLKKAILYIRQNYSQKITLTDLCSFCNVSKQQLIRYFKEYLRTTPVTYINEFKLNKAKEYFLSSPHLSIKEVCNELGFDDQHYFSRIFSKHNGETPSQYKDRVLNFDETKQ